MVDRTNTEMQLQELTKSLPLEKCIFVTESIAQDKGWRAPEGFIFKITGQFIQSHSGSPGNWDNIISSCSVAFLEAHQEDGSEEAGLPPNEFIGKWFYVEIYKSGVAIYVKQDKSFYFDGGKEWLTEIDGYYFSAQGISEVGTIEWEQYYAEGVLGFCTIELVEYEEQELKLQAFEKHISDASITLPSISKKIK